MKINTKVSSFAKGFVEGFVSSSKDPMTHILVGAVVASDVVNNGVNVKRTFGSAANGYLWIAILDGVVEGFCNIDADE